MDASNLNGLEIANLAAGIIAQLAPYVMQGIQLGVSIDPTLGRQLQGAMDIAGAAFADALARHAKASQDADQRLK